MSSTIEAPSPSAVESGPIQHVKSMPSSDYAAMLKEVALSGQKTYFAQVREIYRLKFGPGRLLPIEYYHYALFLDDLTPAQKAAFVGHNLRVQINNTRLNEAALQVGIDKIAFYERAQELGLRVPATRALTTPTGT